MVGSAPVAAFRTRTCCGEDGMVSHFHVRVRSRSGWKVGCLGKARRRTIVFALSKDQGPRSPTDGRSSAPLNGWVMSNVAPRSAHSESVEQS